MGAYLGDADDDQIRGLMRWAEPIGEAFQLRDDLLGTFGMQSKTGKPGEDIRHGKRTALIMEFEKLVEGSERDAVFRFGAMRAGDAERRAIDALTESGAKRRVEAFVRVVSRGARSPRRRLLF
ncbi:MAG: polyprenyl synthetase family protein [Polyangiales bacterium]